VTGDQIASQRVEIQDLVEVDASLGDGNRRNMEPPPYIPGRLRWNLQITHLERKTDLPNLPDYVPS